MPKESAENRFIKQLSPTERLFVAVSNDNAADMLNALKEGATPNDFWHMLNLTVLSYAASLGRENLVGLLIRKGAKVNDYADTEEKALELAAKNGYYAVVDTLLKAGAIVHATCDTRSVIYFPDNYIIGRTAVHKAAKNGHFSSVLLMLERVEIREIFENHREQYIALLKIMLNKTDGFDIVENDAALKIITILFNLEENHKILSDADLTEQQKNTYLNLKLTLTLTSFEKLQLESISAPSKHFSAQRSHYAQTSSHTLELIPEKLKKNASHCKFR